MPDSFAKRPQEIGSALHWAAARLAPVTESPRLEAALLLAHLLDVGRTYLLAHPEQPLSPTVVQAYTRLVERRAAHEPLPYLLGQIEFYGLEFVLTPDVLIPRPETELLVERALDWLHAHPRARVVDVGTGSGCIAVTLARHAPTAHLVATDLSAAALAVAYVNTRRHGVIERLALVRADLLRSLAGPLDLIVSNPPYVSTREWDALPPSVRREPRLALLAGPDGLDALRRLLHQAARRLRPGGLLLAEIGETQGEAAMALATGSFPGASVDLLTDLAGKDRILVVESRSR